jgi:hypothetical protein
VTFNGDIKKTRTSIKEELLKDPSILSSSFTYDLPIDIGINGSGFEWNNDESSKEVLIAHMYSDSDFIDVFKTPMLEGRF